MSDQELEKLLQAAAPPARSPEFWERFPGRITAKIKWQEQQPQAPETRNQRWDGWDWALGFGVVAVVLAITLLLQPRQNSVVAKNELALVQRCYRETEALFPNQVRAVVFEASGPRVVLSEQADVPPSPPLYLKICGPRGCQEIVTFSGQQIRVNGEDCDVLTDAAGGVILAGDHLIWSNHAPRANRGRYQIEACPLEVAL